MAAGKERSREGSSSINCACRRKARRALTPRKARRRRKPDAEQPGGLSALSTGRSDAPAS